MTGECGQIVFVLSSKLRHTQAPWGVRAEKPPALRSSWPLLSKVLTGSSSLPSFPPSIFPSFPPSQLVKEFHPPVPKAGKKYIVGVPCDSAKDPGQLGWAIDAASSSITHGGKCADFADNEEVVLAPCNSSSPTQKFDYDSATGELKVAKGMCLDVFYYAGECRPAWPRRCSPSYVRALAQPWPLARPTAS